MSRKVQVGIDDLKTLYPELINDWDYEQNEKMPEEQLPSSNKKANWKCHVCGNEWEVAIGSRNKGHGCPKCSKKKHNEKGII